MKWEIILKTLNTIALLAIAFSLLVIADNSEWMYDIVFHLEELTLIESGE